MSKDVQKSHISGIPETPEIRDFESSKFRYFETDHAERIIRLIDEGRQKIFRNVLNPDQSYEPLLSINNYPLFFPGTINVLQGQTGTHKSRLAEHMISQIIKKPRIKNLIGLKVHTNNIFCSYVDTERSLSAQLAVSVRNIALNSGLTPEEIVSHKRFDVISLIPFERSERHEALILYLDMIRRNHKGPIFCILDIVSDMITDFNNSCETLKFFDLLNTYINNYNTTFLCIIHENPGQGVDTKARGHLGTELLNKSSTALSINFKERKKNREILVLQFLKNRLAQTGCPLYLKYSEESKCLIKPKACEVDQVRYCGTKADLNKICKFIIEYIKKPVTRQELIKLLIRKFYCSDKTIINYINLMLSGEVINNLGYRFIKLSKQGVNVVYEVQKFRSIEVSDQCQQKP